MDVDPHALTDMFAPSIQKSFQTNQPTYLMNNDTSNSGPHKGMTPAPFYSIQLKQSLGSRQKANGRARSSTNPISPNTDTPDSSPVISRTVSSPTPSTSTSKLQPKP